MTRLIVYSTAFVAFLGGKLYVPKFPSNSSLTHSSNRDDLGLDIHTSLGDLDGRYSGRRTLHQDDWAAQKLFFDNRAISALPAARRLFGL